MESCTWKLSEGSDTAQAGDLDSQTRGPTERQHATVCSTVKRMKPQAQRAVNVHTRARGLAYIWAGCDGRLGSGEMTGLWTETLERQG